MHAEYYAESALPTLDHPCSRRKLLINKERSNVAHTDVRWRWRVGDNRNAFLVAAAAEDKPKEVIKTVWH